LVAAAARAAADVLALVWAGSQVTKLLRMGTSLAVAPYADKSMNWLVDKQLVPNYQMAFVAVTVGCFAGTGQGLTLVHFSAQRKRFLRDRGCV